GLEERASVADSVIYSQSGKLPRQLLGSLFNPGASLLCLFHYGSQVTKTALHAVRGRLSEKARAMSER
ncbi:MAG: hypothetical protein LBK99_04650, partial [Opitutaceae bacterium]|nr:hypothetical protein [Opitutaceae bacterium]